MCSPKWSYTLQKHTTPFVATQNLFATNRERKAENALLPKQKHIPCQWLAYLILCSAIIVSHLFLFFNPLFCKIPFFLFFCTKNCLSFVLSQQKTGSLFFEKNVAYRMDTLRALFYDYFAGLNESFRPTERLKTR